MLIVVTIYKNYAPLSNEFNWISIDLDKSEDMKFYNLNEIEWGSSYCGWHLKHFIYLIVSSHIIHLTSYIAYSTLCTHH